MGFMLMCKLTIIVFNMCLPKSSSISDKEGGQSCGKDNDMSVLYHSDKANVVVDTLSNMSMDSVSHVDEAKKNLVKDVHTLTHLGVLLENIQMVVLWFITTPNHLWWLRLSLSNRFLHY